MVGVTVTVGVAVDVVVVVPEHDTTTNASSEVNADLTLVSLGVCPIQWTSPEGATGMRGFDRAGERSAASRGTPFPLVNPNGSQITGNTEYALAA